MSDNALPLRGEKVSMVSPSLSGGGAWDGTVHSAPGLVKAAAGPRAAAIWAALSLCGALASWAAPALLLHRYRADQLLDALIGSPVRASEGDLLALSLLLAYVVASGLLVGWATARLARRLGRSGVVLCLAMAPLIVLSLAATMAVAVALFTGVFIRCFPSLL
jgi:hypothetical protein